MASIRKKSFDILDCLLPNGVLVPLSCPPDITLMQLKDLLWLEARKYPSFDTLTAASNYVIVGVTKDLRQHTFWDEGQTVADVPLYSPFIKLVLPKEPWEESKLNAQIQSTIGRSIQDLDECNDPEIQSFRQTILKVVCAGISCRARAGLEGIATYHHPPLLSTSPNLPASLTRHLDQGYLHIAIWIGKSKACSVRVLWDSTPLAVIQAALDKLKLLREDEPTPGSYGTHNIPHKDTDGRLELQREDHIKQQNSYERLELNELNNTSYNRFRPTGNNAEQHTNDLTGCNDDCVPPDVAAAVPDEGNDVLWSVNDRKEPCYYVLKICGTSEYLLAEEPVTRYKTIGQFVCRDKTPQLQMLTRGQLYATLSPHSLVMPSYATRDACWRDQYEALTEQLQRGARPAVVAGSGGGDDHGPVNHLIKKYDDNYQRIKKRRYCYEDEQVFQSKKSRIVSSEGGYLISSDSLSATVDDKISSLSSSSSSNTDTSYSSDNASSINTCNIKSNVFIVNDLSSQGKSSSRSNRSQESNDFSELRKRSSVVSSMFSQSSSVAGASYSQVAEVSKVLSRCCNFQDQHKLQVASGNKKVSTYDNFTPSLNDLLNKEFSRVQASYSTVSQKSKSSTKEDSKSSVLMETVTPIDDLDHSDDERECCRCCKVSRQEQADNLWHPSLEGSLKVHILSATNLTVKPGHKVYVCAGLYHGLDELCQPSRTAVVAVQSSTAAATKANSVPLATKKHASNKYSIPAASKAESSSLLSHNRGVFSYLGTNVPGAKGQAEALVQLNDCVKSSSGDGKRSANNENCGGFGYEKPVSNIDRVSCKTPHKITRNSNMVDSNSKPRAKIKVTQSKSSKTLTTSDTSNGAGSGDTKLNSKDFSTYCGGSELHQEPTGAVATWGEWLEFNMNLQDCPRATKLCFSLISASGKEDDVTVLACCTVSLFDWRGQLLQQSVATPLAPPPSSQPHTLVAAGALGCSAATNGALSKTQLLFPHLSSRVTATRRSAKCGQLTIALERRLEARPVMFPALDQVLAYARTLNKIDRTAKKQAGEEFLDSYVSPTDEQLSFICRVSELDPFIAVPSEDLSQLWGLRSHCYRVPSVLPRLLQAVNWASRDMVSQLYLLLVVWWSSSLPVSVCIEVLQARYPDPVVRHTAVQSLSKTLSHQQLQKYLLQLCQCVLQEAYLSSPLLQLLLHRALTNSTLGHFFLHHLRCNGVCLRVLAILEAYCRGVCPSLLRGSAAQVTMLSTLSGIGGVLAQLRDADNKDQCKQLQTQLQLPSNLSTLQDLKSPLYPSQRLGKLNVSACSVLDSARRPLKIVWQNPDPMAHLFATNYSVIFKKGDDLRQDELSLQVLGVMAAIWAEEGLDLRITSYSCLAMHNNMGIIELVNNAKTVYSIQRRARLGAIQVDSSQLYKWIKEHNRGPRLAQAIDTFTQSCAGYCVATFVLGIGDRHPDNIMVNEEGQIFHIDFGHFLGNYKKKFGLPRERVPFVLTQDFLRVIAGGAENPKDSTSFHRFQELCGSAYLALRRHSRLLLSLFALLLDTGLPELQSGADLAYLHRSLGVWCRSEEEALQFFQQQFLQATGGAWTTKLDWFFHSVKHR